VIEGGIPIPVTGVGLRAAVEQCPHLRRVALPRRDQQVVVDVPLLAGGGVEGQERKPGEDESAQ
jgi:hypothetical protein